MLECGWPSLTTAAFNPPQRAQFEIGEGGHPPYRVSATHEPALLQLGLVLLSDPDILSPRRKRLALRRSEAREMHGGSITMRTLLILVPLVLACGATSAGTSLLTVQCEPPKGVREKYGLGLIIDRKPGAQPTLQGPSPDGYQAKLTFLVDSEKKKLTVLWAEADVDRAFREEAKKQGLPTLPLPKAEQFDIVYQSPDVITSISYSTYLYGTVTYSVYPRLGAMFMSYQYLEPNLKNAVQSFFFAKCEFSGG
jgi:hypothetical protein